jgi:hypothetical protein
VQVSPLSQALPQAPQLAASLLWSTQRFPHKVVPPLQTRPQVPAEQTSSVAHALPQAPQFAGSFLVVTQSVPHSEVPPEHTTTQAPLTQLMPASHALPHAPQLDASFFTSTQPPSALQKSQFGAQEVLESPVGASLP